MPQLDKLTYFTQFFWLCLFFFTFYILICNDRDGVLGISRILKLRNQLLSHRGNGTKSKDLRPGSLEDILRKGFNTGVSYMYSSLFEVSQWCKAVDLFGKRKKITLISCFLAFLIFSSFILLVLYYPMVLLLILGRVLTMARGFHFIFDFTGLNTRWFLFTLSVMTLFSCSLSVGPLGFPIPEEVEAVGQVDAPSSLRDIERFLSLSEGSSRPPVEEGGVEGGEEISSEVPPELDPFLFYQFHGEPAFWRLFNSQEATIELQSRHLLGELVFNERPAGELLGRLVELEVTLEQRIFALLIQKPDEGLGLSCSFVFNNRAAIRRIIFGLGKRGNRGRPPSEYILELYNLGLQMDLIGVRNSALFRELEKNLYKLRL